MQVAVIGTGYVGLVSGACFAEFGVFVTCVDRDQAKIQALQQGKIPIYEPGLEEVVARNVEHGRLSFSTDLATAVSKADVVMIAVGTPPREADGEADLSYVFEVTKEIAASLQGYTVIVTKSTVPAGTGRLVHALLKEVAPQAEFDVVSNPEFLREGSAVEDFMKPDRVIIGAETQRAIEAMKKLYRPLLAAQAPIMFTTIESAELIKYASNAFLATKVAFINQMADLCEKCGGDIQEIAKGMGLDHRIGYEFLQAGPGYGGSCFPKDTVALVRLAETKDTSVSIVKAADESNRQRSSKMVQKIIQAFGGNVKNVTIAFLGLTFKPNTDDMRESPSLAIIPALQQLGARIRAYDPAGIKVVEMTSLKVEWCRDAYEAMEGADGVVIVTEWNEFKSLDLQQVKTLLNLPLIIDLRNIYSLKEVQEAGLIYHSIGRKPLGKTLLKEAKNKDAA